MKTGGTQSSRENIENARRNEGKQQSAEEKNPKSQEKIIRLFRA